MGDRDRFAQGSSPLAADASRHSSSLECIYLTGIIVVNNRKATPDQIIQNGDLISNVAHRLSLSSFSDLSPSSGSLTERIIRADMNRQS
jgi:hypothetical protein